MEALFGKTVSKDLKSSSSSTYKRNTEYLAEGVYDDYGTGLRIAGGSGGGAGGGGHAAVNRIAEDRSGYGHGHYGKIECCDLVVDPLTFLALLGGIAGGTAFLNVAITMNINKRRRRRRNALPEGASTKTSDLNASHWIAEGKRRKILTKSF